MTTSDGFVTTDDGLRLFYRQVGDSGDVALFINGIPIVDDFAPLAAERTIVFFDPRNRGRSETVRDRSQIERGVHHDVDDLEAIRRHLRVDRVDVIGHSYAGATAALYAMKYPASTRRVVQIGPVAPDQSRQYPPHLSNDDETLQQALAALGELMKEQSTLDPIEFCRRFWTILNPIYVIDPADVPRLKWARCDDANERGYMPTWQQHILPSIQQLNLTSDDFARAVAPVLVIHGRQDRSGPYGGGRDWARLLPNARLVTVDPAAHVPWIESPSLVFDAIATFLRGQWPATAEQITT
jgi:pimeloyl-ACP methyl ester carboxylesterase